MQTVLVISFLALSVLYLANEVRKKFFLGSEECDDCAISNIASDKPTSRD